MASTMVDRMLDAAQILLEAGRSSSAFKRRAVSTAYYAVFHALAKSCSTSVLPGETYDSRDFERVYRTLDHGPLATAFNKDPLNQIDAVRRIGEVVVRLQSERKRADYLPPTRNVFSVSQANALLRQAREAVQAIDALSAEERRTLAVWLLFKSGRGQ
jgi:uncharacterized protein (UPF0332 family)